MIGIVSLAVTTNLTINFMRKRSAGRRIVGVCKLLKVGQRQAVGEVLLYSEGAPENRRSRGRHLLYSFDALALQKIAIYVAHAVKIR